MQVPEPVNDISSGAFYRIGNFACLRLFYLNSNAKTLYR